MRLSRFVPTVVLFCVASLAYGFEEAEQRLAQEVLDELYLYADFPQLSQRCIAQRLRLSYHQILHADPVASTLRPPINVMLLPLRARATWDVDGQLAADWEEHKPESVITGLTEDYLFEGQLPLVTVERQTAPKQAASGGPGLGELPDLLQPVIEAGVEDYFNQVSQQLVEGSDVYLRFPQLVRQIEEDLSHEIFWELGKEQEDALICARACFQIEDLELSLSNGHLDIKSCTWIPHIGLLAENFEELLSLAYVDDAEVNMQVKGAIEGTWNPTQLLEHQLHMNYHIIFECEENNELCRLEVDLFRQLSSH